MNQSPEWKHFFPYKKVRNEQITAIDFAIKQILLGKKKNNSRIRNRLW